jgi:hypothetical protein
LNPGRDKRFFSSQRVHTDSGVHTAQYSTTSGFLSQVKWLGREFDYSTPFSSEIKNGWSPQLCFLHILSQRGQEHCFCSVTIFAPNGTLKSIIFTLKEINYWEMCYCHIYIYIYTCHLLIVISLCAVKVCFHCETDGGLLDMMPCSLV